MRLDAIFKDALDNFQKVALEKMDQNYSGSSSSKRNPTWPDYSVFVTAPPIKGLSADGFAKLSCPREEPPSPPFA
jgi:hypothetical protein